MPGGRSAAAQRRPVIAILSHSAELGGAELGMLRYLERQTDLDTRVLVFEDGAFVAALRRARVPVRVVGPSPLAVLHGLLRLRHAVERGRVDLVLSNTMRAATLYSALLPPRSRHAYYLQDLVEGGYFSRMKREVLRRVTLPRVGGLLVNSIATRDSLPGDFHALPTEVVHTVSGTSTIVQSTRAGREAEPPRILSLSRVARWKGVHVLVGAVRGSATDWRVTIAGGSFLGESEYQREVLALAGEDPRFDFIGHVNDVPAVVAGHDVLVHCSITPEPFGQVLVQGMAAGLAVVATRGGGPSEIIEDGVSGLLVPAGDEAALRDALVRLTTDAPLRLRLGEGARQRARLFADEAVVARTTGAVLSLVPGGTRS